MDTRGPAFFFSFFCSVSALGASQIMASDRCRGASPSRFGTQHVLLVKCRRSATYSRTLATHLLIGNDKVAPTGRKTLRLIKCSQNERRDSIPTVRSSP